MVVVVVDYWWVVFGICVYLVEIIKVWFFVWKY